MLRVIHAIVVVLVLSAIGAKSYIEARLQRKLAATTISNIDLSKVADGTYAGGYVCQGPLR